MDPRSLKYLNPDDLIAARKIIASFKVYPIKSPLADLSRYWVQCKNEVVRKNIENGERHNSQNHLDPHRCQPWRQHD